MRAEAPKIWAHIFLGVEVTDRVEAASIPARHMRVLLSVSFHHCRATASKCASAPLKIVGDI